MAKKVQTGKTEAKTDQVVQQVVQQVTANSVQLSSSDSELKVSADSQTIIALYAKNNRGQLISFPSYRVIKGSEIGEVVIGSTERAKIFETDENGVLKLDVRTTGRTSFYVLWTQELQSTVI